MTSQRTNDAPLEAARAAAAALADGLEKTLPPGDICGLFLQVAIDRFLGKRTGCEAACWLRLAAAEVEADEMERARGCRCRSTDGGRNAR